MPRINLSKLRRALDKTLSEGRGKQVLWLLSIIVVFYLVFWIIATCTFPDKSLKWQDVLALFLDPGCFGGPGEHDFFRLAAALIGMFFLSALLISVVSNMFENISESFKGGLTRYRHKDHVLILGGGHQLASMLTALSRSDSPSLDNEIVVLTSESLDIVRNHISPCFEGSHGKSLRKRLILYFGERDNENDLKQKDLAKNASVIYIIGDDHEMDHDSISVRCCEKLKALCSGTGHDIPCYLVLENVSSLEVYKYSKDQETRRESDLKVDVIYDKEYVAEQVFIPKTGSEAFPAIDYLEIRKNDKDFQFVSGIKEDSDKYVHLIVGGTTDMAVAMAQTAAHICHFPNFKDGRYRTIITFVDKSMSSWMSHFVCAYDNLFRLSHFKYISFSEGGKPLITYHTPDLDYGDFLDIEWEFVDADLCSTEFSPLLRDAIADDRQALSVVICLPTQQDCTFAATHLPADIYWKGCPIFVHQQDHGDILRQAARTHQFGNLHIFGMASGLIGDALFVNRSTLGRRINFIYDQAQQKVENRHKNEAEAWFDLREAHKFSSIYCANALPMRARSFGLDNFDLSHLQVSQRTSMYETEHRRWMMSSLLLGYRAMNTKYRNELKSKRLDPSTAKEADDVFRTLKTSFFLHMDITPYEDLLPEEKDKDRIILDEISFILNRNE